MFSILKRIVKKYKVKRKTENVFFAHKSDIGKRTVFEGQNKVGYNSWVDGYIGYGTYIGDNCSINAKIGRFCSIGNKVTVLTGTHPSHEFVSTSPVFYSLGMQNGTTFVSKQKFNEHMFFDSDKQYGCEIGNDVWIGFGSVVIGGITIGDGAIIAAGSVVTTNVQPYSIVGGCPAKEISRRFSNNTIAWLLENKWWNKDVSWIKEHADAFESISAFMKVNQ